MQLAPPEGANSFAPFNERQAYDIAAWKQSDLCGRKANALGV